MTSEELAAAVALASTTSAGQLLACRELGLTADRVEVGRMLVDDTLESYLCVLPLGTVHGFEFKVEFK